MNLARCSRVVCLLMLATHAVHFQTYQGFPESLPAAARPLVSIKAPSSPSTFDSEERPQYVEHAARAVDAAGGGGAIIAGTAEVRGESFIRAVSTVVGPDGVEITSGFDSEEPLRGVEDNVRPIGSVGPGGGTAYPSTAEARPQAFDATVSIIGPEAARAASAFDSEGPLREVEDNVRVTPLTGGGRAYEVTLTDSAGLTDSISVVKHEGEQAA